MNQGVTFADNKGPVSIRNESKISRSSILGKLIEIIASANPAPVNLSRNPTEIEKKIEFNNLSTHRWLIEDYIENAVLVDSSITELNKLINSGSTKLKRQMKMFYRKALTDCSINSCDIDLSLFKSMSDNIVASVISQTCEFVRSSSDLQDGYYDEDIEFGVALITSYSIIECIVLENPNDYN